MADSPSYIELCRHEIASLQARLAEEYGPDVHIFEGVNNGPLREITDEIRDHLRHTIKVYQQIVEALERDRR